MKQEAEKTDEDLECVLQLSSIGLAKRSSLATLSVDTHAIRQLV